MNDPNILYDYIWTQEELNPWCEMFHEWKGQPSSRLHKNGDRELLDISHNYPNPSPLLEKYVNFLSDHVAYGLSGFFSSGYSVDARLSRYCVGQQYKWHHDYNREYKHPDNPNWNRIISSITYLNDDYEGGETEFMNGVIVPEAGKTVIFPSSYLYPHRGCPVTAGIKKILVIHFWT